MKKNIVIGIMAGFISGFFSTGGGMLLVPTFLYFLKKEDKKARATAAMCILPMVVTSGIFYYQNNYMDWQIGILCASGGIVRWLFRCKTFEKVRCKIF